MSVRMCCSHQSQAAWTFFPPVETRAFRLQNRKRKREGEIKAQPHKSILSLPDCIY